MFWRYDRFQSEPLGLIWRGLHICKIKNKLQGSIHLYFRFKISFKEAYTAVSERISYFCAMPKM